MTEQYLCPSYVDDAGQLQDCLCNKCEAHPPQLTNQHKGEQDDE